MAHRARRSSKRSKSTRPAAKVWEIVGNFQDLNWHPAIAKTEGTGGNAVDAKRKLTLKNGGVIDEALTKYDADGRSLSYKIDAVDVKVLPVNNYSLDDSREGRRRQERRRMEGRLLSRLHEQ